jgi:uncharacterized protein (DUF305 family)
MNNNTVLVAIIALLIGGIGGYAIAEYKEGSWGRMGHMEMMDYDRTNDSRQNDWSKSDDTVGMMGEGMHMHMMVTSERDFLENMIPHHQEAVDTAKEVLARGATTPDMKALAEGIITAQEKEIADMKMWYKNWYGVDYVDTGVYEPMMRDLSTLEGATLDRIFLEDMIMHHMGAIMMAESVKPYIEHLEVTALTKAIVETQSNEIEHMRDILSTIR